MSRKLFRNTWIHKLPITSKIYDFIFGLLYGDSEKEITFHGFRFLVPTKDTSMIPSIINQDYEELELKIFKQLIRNGDTILDIGANMGIYSVIGSALVGNSGSVHSFEPVPENIRFLTNNIKLNNCQNVTVAPFALGDKKGTEKIYISKKNVGTHSMGKQKYTKKSISIKIDTLKNYVNMHKLNVSVVKMDVEGYEGHVLRGSGDVLRNAIILTEFTATRLTACGESPFAIAQKLLKSHNYCYVINERSKQIELIKSAKSIAKLENSNLLLANSKLNITL